MSSGEGDVWPLSSSRTSTVETPHPHKSSSEVLISRMQAGSATHVPARPAAPRFTPADNSPISFGRKRGVGAPLHQWSNGNDDGPLR